MTGTQLSPRTEPTEKKVDPATGGLEEGALAGVMARLGLKDAKPSPCSPGASKIGPSDNLLTGIFKASGKAECFRVGAPHKPRRTDWGCCRMLPVIRPDPVAPEIQQLPPVLGNIGGNLKSKDSTF